MKIHYYANGGSKNHGCEAIYRSLIGLLPNHQHIIHSGSLHDDTLYRLGEFADLTPLEQPVSPIGIYRIIYALQLKWSKNDKPFFDRAYYRFLRDASKNDIYLSVGGDNYCYSSYDWLEYLNLQLTRKGCKTILAGCSIEPESLTPRLIQDLKRYTHIIARESCTYSALRKAGINNATLLPDPAFSLPANKRPLPSNMIQSNTVGINISPVISQLEPTKGIAFENYRVLIKYIMEETDMTVLLIPHVVKETNDDRHPSSQLLQEFVNTGRISLIEDTNCCTLKGFISQCRFFVAARTHASIAAYSSCIPTLVVGYSIKAKGLALDIFQNCNGYVLPTQALTDATELTTQFKKMVTNEVAIKNHLTTFMPSYIEKCCEYNVLLTQIMQKNALN